MSLRRNEPMKERGQILILCAFYMAVLMLFVGLAIDGGLAYLTKARITKAADAAALASVRYAGKGQSQVAAIAQSVFSMNYTPTNGSSLPPTVSTTLSTDSLGNSLVTVTATASVKTYCMGLLPTFQQLNVSFSSQARYARVQMTLVLDRTGSMTSNAPGTSLPDAVSDFIGQFDDVKDTVALISFANDNTIDFPMQTGGFQSSITSIANGMPGRFNGATYSDGALLAAITEESLPMGLTGTIVHAVVFFTDGNANTVQTRLTCSSGSVNTGTIWNIGGLDSPPNQSNIVGFVSTNNPPSNCRSNGPLNSNPTYECGTQGDVPPNNPSNFCNGTFQTGTGTQANLTFANVNSDALNRSVQDANIMRAAGYVVYSVGLHGPSGVLNNTFLCQIANDPCLAYGGNPTFDPNLPSGEFVPASDYTQLGSAFQEVANNIHLRLVQ